MQKWEYLVKTNLSEVELNALGAQGWELIALSHTDSGMPHRYFFKRPKS
jgi:hypothetical protein